METKQEIRAYLLANLDKYTVWTDVRELIAVWSRNPIVWSWGFHNPTIYNDKVLGFNVNGHLHKGKVFLAVNGSDLFEIYFTSHKGEIMQVQKDVYLEDLTTTIDNVVEKIPQYKY